MEKILKKPTGSFFTKNEEAYAWENRQKIIGVPTGGLPVLYHSVHWTNPLMVGEFMKILGSWPLIPPIEALHFLDAHFPVPEIREFAVHSIQTFTDVQLVDYLFQLIQVLKYEPNHDSPLSRFLLFRALRNRER